MGQLQVINFLNEISQQFPNAISFAAGRPNPSFFNHDRYFSYYERFVCHYSEKRGFTKELAEQELLQYGPSQGVISEIINEYLKKDESISSASAKFNIVTNGCQEALAIICIHELKSEKDCMLTIDPSYPGFSGVVESLNRKLVAIDSARLYVNINDATCEFNWDYLEEIVRDTRAAGLNPKALYINPDFNNPLSYTISINSRIKLLQLCNTLDIRIIEDSVYSKFSYMDKCLPSIKSFDESGIVYHVGTFSKVLCPGLRLGYLVPCSGDVDSVGHLISIKSLISNNTSAFMQAVVGGFLIENGFSVSARMSMLCKRYSHQKDSILQALEHYLSNINGVSWHVPNGGFFCILTVPFDFTDASVLDCAKNYGVICAPVSKFSLYPHKWIRKIRLAFSYYDAEQIHEGVQRLSKYIRSQKSEF